MFVVVLQTASEFVHLTPLYSPHQEEQLSPCFLKEHLEEGQSLWRLQWMIRRTCGAAGGLSVYAGYKTFCTCRNSYPNPMDPVSATHRTLGLRQDAMVVSEDWVAQWDSEDSSASYIALFLFLFFQLHPVPNFVVHSKRLNLCGCWSRRRSCCLQRGGGCHPSCILFTECCRVIGTCASSAKYTIAYRKPSRHTESSFLPLLTLHGTGYSEVEHSRATLFSVGKFTLYCWW